MNQDNEMRSENNPGDLSRSPIEPGKVDLSGFSTLDAPQNEDRKITSDLRDVPTVRLSGSHFRGLVRQADPEVALELLVNEILNLRDKVSVLERFCATVTPLEKRIDDVDQRGRKGYQKIRKSFRNGMGFIQRRLYEFAKDRAKFKEIEPEEVYSKGLTNLADYAQQLDLGGISSDSSRTSFKDGSEWQTDSEDFGDHTSKKVWGHDDMKPPVRAPQKRKILTAKDKPKAGSDSSSLSLNLNARPFEKPEQSELVRDAPPVDKKLKPWKSNLVYHDDEEDPRSSPWRTKDGGEFVSP